MYLYPMIHLSRELKARAECKEATIQCPGGEWNFFLINNFGQTLHEINNLLKERRLYL